MKPPTTANCQACNVRGADMWVTIQGCGSTLVCRDCLADLGDDRSKAAFYRLPSDPRQRTES